MLTFPSASIAAATVDAATAPWWGVPAITATAVLFGALVAYVSARASDERKAKREKAERIMLDTRTVGLEFLDAVNALVDAIKAQEDASRAVLGRPYLAVIQAAFIKVEAQWRKFELFARDDALITGQALNANCISLLIFALGSEHPTESLRSIEAAQYAFVNTLRKASGVGVIKYEDPDLETKKALDADLDVIMNFVEENLAKNHGGPSPQQK